MAKRKLSMSLIVLIVAATTLVSGTYAWFLVGGFAELFDLGFDVIEAGGGIEIQGTNGDAYKSNGGEKVSWGSYLDFDNFKPGTDILVKDTGKYAPVSSANGSSFKKVGLEGSYFKMLSGGAQPGVDYNDFVIKIRSDNDQTVNAKMKIVLSGDQDALDAARISVAYNGAAPTIYAANDTSCEAVTGDIPDSTVYDSNGDAIVSSGDTNYGYVSAQTITKLTQDGTNYQVEHDLPNVPANSSSADIAVRIWMEGNDSDCIGTKLPQKKLNVKITFGSAE